MKKITFNLLMLLFFAPALFAQTAGTSLANDIINPQKDQLKMEQVQNPAGDFKSKAMGVKTNLIPPTNFAAQFLQGLGVYCEWEMENPDGEWIGYDDGVNIDGLGLNGDGTFWGAIRWAQADLAAYDGWFMTDFEFVPRLFQNQAILTFMIWEGPNAANLIYEQELFNLNWNQWNTLALDEMHLIDASSELWIGIKVTHVDAEYPLGFDNGPAVAGFGDMISLDGVVWKSMSNFYALDYNFNLKGFVTDVIKGKTGDKTVIAQSVINPKAGPVRGKLKPIENPDLHNYIDGLVGYNVYRNGTQVNPEPVLGLSMTDPFFTQGTYTYNAKAVYTEGLSEASNSVVVAIAGGVPDIEVTPTSLSETHNNPPEVTSKILTLTNTGNAPLTFNVGTSTLLLNKTSVPKIGHKEYEQMLTQRRSAEGQPNADVQYGVIPGQPQSNGNHYSKYITSDATRGVLYNNGSFITAEGVGSNGTDYSMNQDTSLGMAIYGFGCQIPYEQSIADDFEVSGNWTINSFTFFAYQTGSGPPSTLNDVRVQVYDGNPSAGGIVIFGDLLTNVMLSTEWTNVWRVIESGITENRPIMNIVADVSGLQLAAGTYWVEMQVAGTGAAGPWAPPVTILGETTTGNSIQHTTTGWAPLIDVGPQGLPFIIEGTTGAPTADWYSVIPANGVINPGESMSLTVTFNSEGLEDGTYTDMLNILSNDPDEPTIGVPVTLSVIQSLQVPRDLVLVEVAMAFWDPYSPGAALGTEDLIANGHNVAVIHNHNGDSLATIYSNARNSYYNITGYPTAKFDGILAHVGGGSASTYPQYLPKVEQRNATLSDFTIDLNLQQVQNNDYHATVQLENVGAYPGSNLVLQAVVTESMLDINWGLGDYVNSANRLMVPNQNGTAISFAGGDVQTIELDFTLEDYWIPENCELIVFVQDNSTKEILQATLREFEAQSTSHFETAWTSPYNPMTFYILEAAIDELPLQAGAEVGLFDIDPITGEEICVGAGVLIEELGGDTYLEFIASMDDGSNPDQANGFTPGNDIIYKLWNLEEGEIISITANYPYPGYDEVYTSQGSAFVELHGITEIEQCIALSTGWNIMSFRAMPENPDMLEILQPLINNDNLYKVLDEAGGSVFHLPFPPPNGQWSNTIGNLQATEGYYIKVTQTDNLCIMGMPVETPLEIQLTTGWNIISYPCEYAQDALEVLQPLIDQDVLYKVIDEAGGSVFHLPFPPPNGQWSNTIGNFESGEGYYVKVTGNATLTIDCPAGPSDLTNRTPEIIDPVYFNPVYENNPYSPMHIVLSPCEELQSGDEIAVFDGSVCVGAAVVNGDRETPIIITTSQHDPASEMPNGFTAGDEISLMVWNSGTGEISKVEYEYLEGSQTFAPLETMFGELKSGIFDNENPNTADLQLQVIPNPFAQKTSALFFLRESGTVKMHIQNMNGITMDEIPAREMEKGQQNIALDLQKLGSGIYFLLIEIETENSSNSYIQKLIKM